MFRSWFTLVFAVMVLNLFLNTAARANGAPTGVWGGSMERWLHNCGKKSLEAAG